MRKIPQFAIGMSREMLGIPMQRVKKFSRFVVGIYDQEVFLEDLKRHEPVNRAEKTAQTLAEQLKAEPERRAAFEEKFPGKEYFPAYLVFLARSIGTANREVVRRYNEALKRQVTSRGFAAHVAREEVEAAQEDVEQVAEIMPVVVDAIPLLLESLPEGEESRATAETIVADALAPISVLEANVVRFPQQRTPGPGE